MDTDAVSIDIEGKTLSLSIPSFAVNADSSVLIEMQGTLLLVTVAVSKEETHLSYFPLTVDFEERFYAVSKILGSRFTRREGRPSLDSVLTARIVDRTIRPLFPEGFKRDVQIVITPLAIGTIDPSSLGVIGASVALQMSSVPWNGPVSALPYGFLRNEWHVFPSFEEIKSADGEGIVCVYDDRIIMVEMQGREIEKDRVKTILTHPLFKKINDFQMSFIKNKTKEKIVFETPSFSEEQKTYLDTLLETIDFTSKEKNISVLKQEWINHIDDAHGGGDFFDKKVKEHIHKNVVVHNKRIDGRALDEIRPLFAQAGGVSDVLHGSGLFYRGETRVFCALTLGSPEDTLLENSMLNSEKEHHFFLHYNFPPYASGETGRMSGPNRRMLGHGALAQKALEGVLPPIDTFPYTIRLVTDCFSSNGSTSMGSVCAGTLALMDGGVPIARPVSGIAIGIAYYNDTYKTITDIQGLEDAFLGMDFKVAGTERGITAIQMDTKLQGVPVEHINTAIDDACHAYGDILDVFKKAIQSPRASLSSNAPLLEKITIPVDMIGLVIGSAGKTIQGLQKDTGATITIDDDGGVTFSGTDVEISAAKEKVLAMTKIYQTGDSFKGSIVDIRDFGFFVDLGGNTQGLLHISEIEPEQKGEKTSVSYMKKKFNVGDVVEGIIKGKNPQGKISLGFK